MKAKNNEEKNRTCYNGHNSFQKYITNGQKYITNSSCYVEAGY